MLLCGCGSTSKDECDKLRPPHQADEKKRGEVKITRKAVEKMANQNSPPSPSASLIPTFQALLPASPYNMEAIAMSALPVPGAPSRDQKFAFGDSVKKQGRSCSSSEALQPG